MGQDKGWEQWEKAKAPQKGRQETHCQKTVMDTTTQFSNTKGLMLGQAKFIGIWSSYNQKGQDAGQWGCTG